MAVVLQLLCGAQEVLAKATCKASFLARDETLHPKP